MKPIPCFCSTAKRAPARRLPTLGGVLVAAVVLAACGKTAEPAAAEVAAMPPSNAASAMNVADIDVTTNVKTALLNEPTLKSMDIAVMTTQGDVRLSGMVDSQAQIDTALKLARAADGVHTLHDELTVKK